MDWKTESSHVWRAAVSVFSPVYRVNEKLGPVSFVLSAGLSSLVGFIADSPAWGVATLFGIVAILTFIEVVRREQREDRRSKSDLEKQAESARLRLLHTFGEMCQSSLGNGDLLVKWAKTDEEFEDAIERSAVYSKKARDWMGSTESWIKKHYNAQTAMLFRAHPEVALTSSPPPDLRPDTQHLWEEVGYRLTWIAKRVASIETEK